MGRSDSQKGVAITIGNFDGLHKGHIYLLDTFYKIADSQKLTPLVLTFTTHPKIYFQSKKNYLLMSPSEKVEILKQKGFEVEILKEEIFSKKAEEFLEEVLIKKYKMKLLLMGYNHRFGKDSKGTPQYIASLIPNYDFSLVVLPPYKINGVKISSTLIRNLLLQGKIKEANSLLGRNYSISGKVVKGSGIATQILGVATANLEIDPLILKPAAGSYAVLVWIEGKRYHGTLYIGDAPTLKNTSTIEVHVHGYKGKLYNQTIKIEFVEYIRKSLKFESIEKLKKAIEQDLNLTKKILQGIP